MEIKNKIKQIILGIVCGALLILTLFLGITAVACQISGGTPNFFGTSIYIVNTDAFDLLENGTALIAKQVQYSEIQPGNIVIFSLENKLPALAEINSSELSDGVYSFTARTENDSTVTLSQGQILAKGVSYSNFWGGVISFASSPIGLMLIAVTPCLIIIIVEFSKFLRKAIPEPEIETVKKQLEIPTYTPESGKAAAAAAYKRSGKTDTLDDSIGLYDAQVRKSPNIARTDVLEISSQPESPLFLGPKHKPIAIQSQRQQTMPLSQKKLNDAIAAAKAEREAEEENRRRAETVRDIQKSRGAAIAAEKERENEMRIMQREVQRVNGQTARQAVPNQGARQRPAAPIPGRKEFVPEFKPAPRPALQQEDEVVRQYTPRKAQRSGVSHATSSIPRLDELLNEENDGKSYNIDEILSGLDKNK